MFLGHSCTSCCNQACMYIDWNSDWVPFGMTPQCAPVSEGQYWGPFQVTIPDNIHVPPEGVEIFFEGGFDDKGFIRYRRPGSLTYVEDWGTGSPTSCFGGPPKSIICGDRDFSFVIVDTQAGYVRVNMCICVKGASHSKYPPVQLQNSDGYSLLLTGFPAQELGVPRWQFRYRNWVNQYSNWTNEIRSCGPIKANPLP